MKKWLKYILISMFLIVGIDGVEAATLYDSNINSLVCHYVADREIATVSNAVMKCKVDNSGNLNCFFDDVNASISENNLKYENFKSGDNYTCPSVIYAKYELENSFQFIAGETITTTEYHVKKLSLSKIKGGFSFKNVDSENIIDKPIIGGSEDDPGKDYLNSCSDLGETGNLIRKIYNLLKYLIPVLVIGLSIIDFLKVIADGEEKVFNEAWKKFIKRIIVGIVILIIPFILSFILNISGILDNYQIDKNNIFCIFK